MTRITINQPAYTPNHKETQVLGEIQSFIARSKYARMLYNTEQSICNLPTIFDENFSPPTEASIHGAIQWISSYFESVMSLNLPWLEPHVTTNENGTIVLEWMKNNKRLTVYISDTEIWYLRSWGTNIENEMEDGDMNLVVGQKLWMWLHQ